MDIESIRQIAINKLAAAGVDNAIEEVDILSAWYLARNSSEGASQFLQSVERRATRVPLAYILGEAEFDKKIFSVGEGAFVPREQSMPLVETVCEYNAQQPVSTVVDLCAGVGTLGITLALHVQAVAVIFVEHNPVACQYLKKNITALLPTEVRTQIYPVDLNALCQSQATRHPVDVVIANPPFVAVGCATMPEYYTYHPADSIFADNEGYAVVEQCCALAKHWLRPGGTFGIEHHESQMRKVSSYLKLLGFDDVRNFFDGDAKSRITVARSSAE